MASINVNRNVIDPFYRYKMPRLQAKVEGKGNGIKTVIVNMTDIAKALGRPPTYPTKFFGIELGSQTRFDPKNERYIVNGAHGAEKLQDLLDVFIKKFVLCTGCENPETGFLVKKGVIHSKCNACGHGCVVDPKHKLSTFIVKHPPVITDAYGSASNGSDGQKKEDVNDFDIKENVSIDDDDDGDWAEPTETEMALSANIGKLVIDKDLDKSVDDRLDMLHAFFIEAKKDGSIKDCSKMLNEAQRLELKTKAPLLLADVLLDQNVLKQLEEYMDLFKSFLRDDPKAQRNFLGGIEQLVQKHGDVMKSLSGILLTCYENDLLDEDVIVAWAAKPSSKYVKKSLAREVINASQGFLNWLATAEEEEDDDEIKDDDGITFDDRDSTAGTTVTEAPKTKGTTVAAASKAVPLTVIEDGKEVNIDDI